LRNFWFEAFLLIFTLVKIKKEYKLLNPTTNNLSKIGVEEEGAAMINENKK